MKKTLKKALTVMAVIVAVMLMMTFAASAVSDCGNGNHNIATRSYDATCEKGGFTESFCTICGNVLGTTPGQPALGHDYEGVSYQYVYVAANDSYKRGLTCQRATCGKTQYDSHLEGSTSVFDRYYLVELVNPWTASVYCSDITYTNVVEIYKEELVKTRKNAEYGKWFIKEGETLESYAVGLGYADYAAWMDAVDNENFVQRFKDKKFGAYNLSGWTNEKKDSGEFTDADLIDFAATVVTANDKIYAAFTGDEEIYYTVQYMNANSDFYTILFDVRHGKKADDSIFNPEYNADKSYVRDENGVIKYNSDKLTLPETMGEYYTYAGWNIDHEHIYGNVTITAVYNTHKKVYEFALNKWDSETSKFVPTEATATAQYGLALNYANLPDGMTINDFTKRDKDRSYIYSWDGNWQTIDGGFNVNGRGISVPYGTLDTRYKDTEGYKPLEIKPTYIRNYNEYKTTVTIKFDNTVKFESESTANYEKNTYLNGLNVQITDANGQLMARGTADLVPGTDYAQFQCSLYDSTSYTVTVTSYRGKYSGATTLSRTYVYGYDAPVHIAVGLSLDQGYIDGQTCHCICHNTLFKPIWVRILNLLYNLFNVKYVCCDDMYASIGGLLDYVKY